MDCKKFLESKIGSFLGKSRFFRLLVLKLYMIQQKRIGVIFIPEEYAKCDCGYRLINKRKSLIKYYYMVTARYVRFCFVKIRLIKEGDNLWYLYLPTDEYIDKELNKNSAFDMIKRGDKYNYKHKNTDYLRKGFYDKQTTQAFIEHENKRQLAIRYYSGASW